MVLTALTPAARRPKRHAGDGSFRQKPTGTGEGRITIDGKSRSFGGKTLREARDKVAAAKAHAQQSGELPDKRAARLTLGNVVEEWLQLSVTPDSNLRRSTRRKYERDARNHVLSSWIADRRAASLSRADFRRFFVEKSKGLSPQQVKHIYTVLSQALRANDHTRHVMPYTPKELRLPQITRAEIEGLDAAEAAEILKRFDDHALSPFVTLCLLCGLRNGEALGLTWGDVDFEAGRLSVRRQWELNEAGDWEAVPLKTAESRRTLDMPALVMAKLREQKMHVNEMRLRSGKRWDERFDCVFPGERGLGKPTHVTTIDHQFKTRLAENDGAGMRVYDLRHGAASLMLKQGLSLREIMEQLGHSQIGVTANLYNRVAPEMKQKPARAMDELFGAGQAGRQLVASNPAPVHLP
jgi:integrase